MAAGYRIYIDESGDHTYRGVQDLHARYLALTAVVVVKTHYETTIHPALEGLKRRHFSYDPDNPVIFHRADIVKQKRWFGVLREPARKQAWEDDLVLFFQELHAQVFTVVIDKQIHKQQYPVGTFDPYDYSLAVLLNRIRGYLNIQRGQADVIAESRGRREDEQLKKAYRDLRVVGGGRYGTALEYQQVFPEDELVVSRKENNVAGLQIADLLAADQKVDIVIRNGKPPAAQPSAFAQRLTAASAHMINGYGRYLLE